MASCGMRALLLISYKLNRTPCDYSKHSEWIFIRQLSDTFFKPTDFIDRIGCGQLVYRCPINSGIIFCMGQEN